MQRVRLSQRTELQFVLWSRHWRLGSASSEEPTPNVLERRPVAFEHFDTVRQRSSRSSWA